MRCRPFHGLRPLFVKSTWGLRPRLYACACFAGSSGFMLAPASQAIRLYLAPVLRMDHQCFILAPMLRRGEGATFGLCRASGLLSFTYNLFMQNKEIRLASRPAGIPTLENFEFAETDLPQPASGEVLVRLRYISVDPYLRGRMREGKSYIAPFEVGQVIESGAVGEVIESNSPNLKPGDLVSGSFGWRLYDVAKANAVMKVIPGVSPTTALGVLGMPGLTAYFGLLDIGQPKEGETVVVSGAAGAVGMTVCQIAKIKGCRVVAIAGSDEKNEYLRNELGVDATINYKTTKDMFGALKEACPNGIDVYFDNVGGDVSDAVFPLLANGARIVICGQISMYNSGEAGYWSSPSAFHSRQQCSDERFHHHSICKSFCGRCDAAC